VKNSTHQKGYEDAKLWKRRYELHNSGFLFEEHNDARNQGVQLSDFGSKLLS